MSEQRTVVIPCPKAKQKKENKRGSTGILRQRNGKETYKG
jgi:hypothetical protein